MTYTRRRDNYGWTQKGPHVNAYAASMAYRGVIPRRELEATIKKLTEENKRMRERILQLENRR